MGVCDIWKCYGKRKVTPIKRHPKIIEISNLNNLVLWDNTTKYAQHNLYPGSKAYWMVNICNINSNILINMYDIEQFDIVTLNSMRFYQWNCCILGSNNKFRSLQKRPSLSEYHICLDFTIAEWIDWKMFYGDILQYEGYKEGFGMNNPNILFMSS